MNIGVLLVKFGVNGLNGIQHLNLNFKWKIEEYFVD